MAIFILLLVLSGYSYFLYPAFLLMIPPRKNRIRSQVQGSNLHRISVIIAARNEELRIREKIKETIALSRGGFAVEIIVASDASEDETDSIALTFAEDGVILARSPIRGGKEEAQRYAIERSTGEVLVFTDAGTSIPSGSLLEISRIFNDSSVGAVSSVDRLESLNGKIEGEGLYVKYEMWLREREAKFHTLVGLSGSFFAARREVCADWDTNIPSDFGVALNCARVGYRAVIDKDLIGIYKNIADPSKEYERKVRTVLRGMAALYRRREVLNPRKFGWFSFLVFSHKLMRWAVPWLMLPAILLNAAYISKSPIFCIFGLALGSMIAAFICVRYFPSARRLGLVRIPGYFMEANVAVAQASILFMMGRRITSWDPSRR